MRLNDSLSAPFFACALVALAGCQGTGGSPVTPSSTANAGVSDLSVPAAKSNELLYTATLDWDAGTGQVYVYHAYGKNNAGDYNEVDFAAGFPEGLWTDAKGDVYVAMVNAGPRGSGYVAEYSPGMKKQINTYNDGFEGPSSGAFDAAGNMYVANLCSQNSYSCGVFAPAGGPYGHGLVRANATSQESYGYVTIFPAGSTKPSSYLYPPITNAVGVTVDATGNVFVIDLLGDPIASEFPAGSTQPKTVTFKGLPNEPAVMGVTTNSAGALVLAVNQNIDFFPKERKASRRSRSG